MDNLTEEQQISIVDLSSTIFNTALLKRKTEKWFRDTVKAEAKKRYGAKVLIRLTYGEFEPDSPGDISWRVHNGTIFIHHCTQSYYKPLLVGVDYEKALKSAAAFVECHNCPIKDHGPVCCNGSECINLLTKYFKDKSENEVKCNGI